MFQGSQLLKRLIQINEKKVLVSTQADEESSLILIELYGNNSKVICERKFDK